MFININGLAAGCAFTLVNFINYCRFAGNGGVGGGVSNFFCRFANLMSKLGGITLHWPRLALPEGENAYGNQRYFY